MQIEPENSPQAESSESKSKRGGKRPGAGRKPNLAKRLLKGFSRDALLEAADNIDVGAVITSLLRSKREKTRLETLLFVRDSVLGRPAQSLNVSGGLMHAHTAWRPLSTLSDAEIEQLDAIINQIKANSAGSPSPSDVAQPGTTTPRPPLATLGGLSTKVPKSWRRISF